MVNLNCVFKQAGNITTDTEAASEEIKVSQQFDDAEQALLIVPDGSVDLILALGFDRDIDVAPVNHEEEKTSSTSKSFLMKELSDIAMRESYLQALNEHTTHFNEHNS